MMSTRYEGVESEKKMKGFQEEMEEEQTWKEGRIISSTI